MLTDYFDSYVSRYRAYKGGDWCYEDGCIYRGLELLHRVTGEARWLNHLKRLVDAQIGEGPSLSGYDLSTYNIDNILPGRALLYLAETTGESSYMDTAALLIGQLATQPRTHSGVYWHKLRYPWQIWLDGLYMGLPFEADYGLRTGDKSLVRDAIKQMGIALDMTQEPATGLYAHAVDEARKQRWADPETGRSPAHWSRAIGWLTMGLVDLADIVGQQAFAPLHDRTVKLLSDVAALRRPEGLWLQVIDRPDLAGNYLETSASAMFAYALTTGSALGLFNGNTSGFADAVARYAVRARRDGTFEMAEICEVAGLGMYNDRYRDGSAEYYLSEARICDDAKGVGPMMMCYAASLERAREPAKATG